MIGTKLGWGNWSTVALAIVLAFFFGYSLTLIPLVRAGLALAAALPLAFASDTLSITVMEIVDNAIVLVIPGAMEAELADWLFWGSLALALAVAFVVRLSGEPVADHARERARARARAPRPLSCRRSRCGARRPR